MPISSHLSNGIKIAEMAFNRPKHFKFTSQHHRKAWPEVGNLYYNFKSPIQNATLGTNSPELAWKVYYTTTMDRTIASAATHVPSVQLRINRVLSMMTFLSWRAAVAS